MDYDIHKALRIQSWQIHNERFYFLLIPLTSIGLFKVNIMLLWDYNVCKFNKHDSYSIENEGKGKDIYIITILLYLTLNDKCYF